LWEQRIFRGKSRVKLLSSCDEHQTPFQLRS
jgi:hypothetical protein